MRYWLVILNLICFALLMSSCGAEENETADSTEAIKYYLFEEDPGELYWEAEAQTDLGNFEQAKALFRQSCDSGVGGSCAILATMYNNGEGGSVDFANACHFFQKSCDMGFVQACTVVASALEGDVCGPTDLGRARKLYSIACKIGHQEACVDLGLFFERGRGGDADINLAKKQFLEACSNQVQRGCVHYASLVFSGHGDALEIKDAIKFVQQGCAAEDPTSCYILGKAQSFTGDNSEKVDEYFVFARSGFQSECIAEGADDDFGNCFDYNFMVARGLGGPKDFGAALSYFEKACSMGHQPACEEKSALSHLD